MKKLLLLAIAALSVSVAQAVVTVGWSDYPSSGSTTIASSTSGVAVDFSRVSYTGTTTTSGSAGSLAATTWYIPDLAFVISSASQWSSDEIRAIGAVLADSTGTITSVSSSTIYNWVNYGGTGSNIYYPNQNNKGMLEFTFSGTLAEVSSTDTVTVYFVNTLTPSTDLIGQNVSVLSDSLYTASSTATLYGTDVGFRVTVAPEPTVLALLALGVAGIALRRRA